jgi:asparagine synthase (glutamine-hydrolysing)
VFLTTYHVMRKLGMNPSRLKAFTLSFGDGPDLQQARDFSNARPWIIPRTHRSGPREHRCGRDDSSLEDYKPLDVECASMGLTLCRGIRARYPEWRYLIDGDGGDENLKDYPIEENPELTIRSVVHNTMLYQEGWGVGKIKHSLTYSGGLSRSYARTYAPAKHFGFEGFSPFHAAERDRSGGRHSVHRIDRLRRGETLRVEGRNRFTRREGDHGIRHAGISEAALSTRRGARR